MGNATKDFKPESLSVKVSSQVVEGERQITAIVSSGGIDRDREMVDVPSLRLPLKGGGFVYARELTGNEKLDVPMLMNHSFNVEDTIGSVRKAYVDDKGQLVCVFGISSRAKAQDIMTLFDEGHLDNAFSLTMNDYMFDEESKTIFDAEIVEISAVFRGSNKEAAVQAIKSLSQKSMEELETLKAENEDLKKQLEEASQHETEVTETVEEVTEEVVVEEVEEVEEIEEVEEEANLTNEKTMSEKVILKQVVDAPVVEVEETVIEKMDKYELASKQFVAFVNKDAKALSELNQIAIDSYKNNKSKATYLNTGVTADGGAIVPSAELLTDVYTTLKEYSTVSNDLRVITLTEGDSLDVATLITDVTVTEVAAEGDDKPVTKPVLGDGNIALREFAGIAIMTKKLVRQAAVNVYDILRESFARAIANRRAVLALTDATSGIVNKVGVVEVEGDSWAEVRSIPYSIPAGAVQGAKYYISRELLADLDSETDLEGRDQNIVTLDGDGLSGTFKNGFKFAVEEVLGTGDAPHAVFGAMGRFGILLRQGTVESETFDTGTVVDGSDVEHNLLQQNKLAHRVAFYENVGYPIPGAFAILVAPAS
jgi:HK97 family phage major capsid protein